MSNVYEALQRARRQGGPIVEPGPVVQPGPVVEPGPVPRPVPSQPAAPTLAPSAPGAASRFGRFPEAMSALFGAVRPLLDSKGGTVLHIVATTEGEGASTVAREFAVMAATTGHRRTLLLDGDRRNPQTARSFECPTNRGIVDCMWQQAEFGEVLRPYPNSLLSVGCLAGEQGANAIDIESMRALLATLRNRFELTIVDCPPIASGAYSDLIPEAADGIILVVQAERIRPAVIVHAKELVQQAGGNVLGAVLNRRKNYIPSFLYRAI